MSTFWIHSSSRARFEQSFGEITDQIRTDACEFSGSDSLQTVSRWLSDRKNGPWLIILDNADDARVLLDLPQDHAARNPARVKRSLIDCIPQVPHGNVLVTTRDRNSGWALTGDYSTPIEVESTDPVESLELLKGKLPIESENEAMELLRELEYVPLAISQAAAYIRERGPLMTIRKYRSEFRKSQDNQTRLLNSNHADLRRDGELPNAVIASWQLSFDHMRTAYPEAADLLSFMSILNHQAIPKILLQGWYNDLAFCEVMGPLLNFSLVRADTTGRMFELHRLVQIATRHWLERNGSSQHWIDYAINRMIERIPPFQEQNWIACETLLSHLEEILRNEAGSLQARLEHSSLQAQSCYYLIEVKGDYLLAEERLKKALVVKQSFYPAGHYTLLGIMEVISYAYNQQRKFQEAEKLNVEIMEQRMKNRGEMDDDTLRAMANLAGTYTCLRKYEKAEELYLRVRDLQSRLSGPKHPNLIMNESRMAHLKNEQSDFQTAETLSLSALVRATTLFGSDHILAFTARQALLVAYMGQKKYVKAEKLGLEDLSMSRRVFGESHSRSLTIARQLVLLYFHEGRLVEAERQCRECLGLNGPEASRMGGLLGRILFKQDDFLAASELFAKDASISKDLFGAKHEETIGAVHQYALCAERLGNMEEAIRLMTKVVDAWTKLVGADHPHTVNSAEWLTRWMAAEDEEDA